MSGILSVGTYLPRWRLTGEASGSAWGRSGGGQRAVAAHDEDSLTLATAAAGACLEGLPGAAPTAVLLASTSAPFWEKSSAAILSESLDLPATTLTLDLGSSARTGVAALALAAGLGRPTLVAAGECRPQQPGSALERFCGDGGAALLVGEGDVLAEIVGSFSLVREFPDYWRRGQDAFVQSGDPRLASQEGYEKTMIQAIQGALAEWGVAAGDIAQAVLGAQDVRAPLGVLKRLGLRPPAGPAAEVAKAAGMLGTVHPLWQLAAALEVAQPGDRILVAGYGDGADVVLLRVTPAVERLRGAARAAAQLAAGTPLDHYNRYLRFRGLLPVEEGATGFTAAAMVHREKELYRRLWGRECPACGFLLTLDLQTCPKCHSHGEFRSRKLARSGRIFGFTHEWYYPTPDPPVTMAVVDLEGGGRLTLQLADTRPEEVSHGQQVELVLRRLHDAGGLPHYYWKARPVADGAPAAARGGGQA